MLEGSDASQCHPGTPTICLASRADPATADADAAVVDSTRLDSIRFDSHTRVASRERFFLVVPFAARARDVDGDGDARGVRAGRCG